MDQGDDVMAGAMELGPLEQQAFSLSRVAILLDTVRQGDSKPELAAALEENLELWVAIRTLAESPQTKLAQEIKENLVKLSNFVAETIMKRGVDVSPGTLDTLININLQICEGLLESVRR